MVIHSCEFQVYTSFSELLACVHACMCVYVRVCVCVSVCIVCVCVCDRGMTFTSDIFYGLFGQVHATVVLLVASPQNYKQTRPCYIKYFCITIF